MPKARAAALADATRVSIYLYMRYDPGGISNPGVVAWATPCWEPGPRVDGQPLGAS
jgi:hypothetical protein